MSLVQKSAAARKATTLEGARRRGRPPKADRASLVLAARRVLAQTGAGASMSDIAGQAGVAEGTLYLHFRNKGALLAAVIGQFYEDLFPQMSAIVDANSPSAERLKGLIARHLKIYEDDPGLARLLLTQIRTASDYAASALYRLNARHAGLFAAVIADGVRRREFRADLNIRLARDVLLGAVDYHTWLAAVTDRPINALQDAEAIGSMCLAGLAPPVGADQ